MEALTILEQKVLMLVAKISELNSQIENLKQENMSLEDKNFALEEALLRSNQDVDQDKELTRMVVEGLIKNVDSVLASACE
jgi:hypothetical protein